MYVVFFLIGLYGFYYVMSIKRIFKDDNHEDEDWIHSELKAFGN